MKLSGKLASLVTMLHHLPPTDRREVLDLLAEWTKATDPEERASIIRAIKEIMAQVPVVARPMGFPGHPPSTGVGS